MTDIPVIFSGPMVRALLEGRKTMTRRLAWREPRDLSTGKIADSYMRPSPWQTVKPGDRLWVRESHQFRGADYGDSDGEIEWFRTYGGGGAPDNWDPEFPESWEPSIHDGVRELTEPNEREEGVRGFVTKLRPSIHMPRWASRLTLIVTATKIELLQDISEIDAMAEGWERAAFEAAAEVHHDAARDWFSDLWESLHGIEAWKANPEVVALTFRVVNANIDAPEAMAA